MQAPPNSFGGALWRHLFRVIISRLTRTMSRIVWRATRPVTKSGCCTPNAQGCFPAPPLQHGTLPCRTVSIPYGSANGQPSPPLTSSQQDRRVSHYQQHALGAVGSPTHRKFFLRSSATSTTCTCANHNSPLHILWRTS